MEIEIIDILETATIAVSGFMIKKYVLLEPDMEAGKQRRVYLLSFLVIATVLFIFGKDAASVTALCLIGLNICLNRKEHKFQGLLLMIPFIGIINGLLVPVMLVPPYLCSLSKQGTLVYQYMVYGILFLLLVLFYVKGKVWRSWFDENTQNRNLRWSEKFLLCMTGVLMLFFSNEISIQINADKSDYWKEMASFSFVSISSIAAFIMTITIIVLIMQGNKRSYYHNRVSEMQFNIITMMADIVENRDNNTGGHIKRTAKYVEIIAKELKIRNEYPEILTEKYVENMIIAAPLHDIGKIHISDVILNKPGRLTDEEFEIMKTHAAAGRDLLIHAKDELGESRYLDMAIDMAAFHHEWWNGNGYPCGIKEQEIPLCARIMAVADVFDALTAKRCYKNAMPLEKALAIIREESGTHFDPIVAEAFLSAMEK